MTIGLFSTSRAITLAQNAEGVVSITDQKEGFIDGLLAEVTGLVNGGSTTSVGASHTAAELGKIFIGAKFRDNLAQLPGVGSLLS